MNHLRNLEVLRYLKGEQSTEARSRFVDHVRTCEACRTRVEQEHEYDQALRHRIAYHKAPAHLLANIRDGLDQAARRQRHQRRPGAWVSSLAAGVAAAASLLLVLVPAQPGALFHEGLVAAGPLSGAFRNLRGQLVCTGCARSGVADIKAHQRCTQGEAHGHVTGLLEADGRVWRFMPSAEVTAVMGDPMQRGQRVDVSALPFENIEYLRVYDVQNL